MKPDLNKVTCIEDLHRVFRCKVPKMFHEYVDSGSWTESTWRANSDDFAAIKFRQKVLVDLENRNLVTQMLGQDVRMPIAISPTGFTGMMHADGEILAARAAENLVCRTRFPQCRFVRWKMWRRTQPNHFGFNYM